MSSNKYHYFESVKRFNDECNSDIQKLVSLARLGDDDMQLYVSSAVVLLGAKFESCVENIIKEYTDKINNEVPKDRVPLELKYSSIHKKLTSYNTKLSNIPAHYNDSNNELLKVIEEFVNKIMDNTNTLEINNKFNYGKHGYNELVKLFNNIAVDIKDDIFDKHVTPSELYATINEQVSFEGIFNRFMTYRNRVAHENKYPNITSADVDNIVETFKIFINTINEELQKRMKKMTEV